MAMINTKLDPAVDSVPDEIPAEIRRRYLGFLMFVGIIILLGFRPGKIINVLSDSCLNPV